MVHDNTEVFPLHDKDSGFCNKLAKMIPTTMDKPVYLSHRSIPLQLKGKSENTLMHGKDKV